MPLLGVNIDHVATLRQARYRAAPGVHAPADLGEPDPAAAAAEAELGGADIITVHLREDRRHIQDRDVERVAQRARARVNLEMGATDEMVAIARRLASEHAAVRMSTLVPEGRQEVTTEGGLDVAGQVPRLKAIVATLKSVPAGMTVSAFIDADSRQIEAAAAAGFDACELHTGPYAAAFAVAGGDELLGSLTRELARLTDAAHRVRAGRMRLHAGHALNYLNVAPIAAIPGMAELHIGHAIISRAVFTGLRQAVHDMKQKC